MSGRGAHYSALDVCFHGRVVLPGARIIRAGCWWPLLCLQVISCVLEKPDIPAKVPNVLLFRPTWRATRRAQFPDLCLTNGHVAGERAAGHSCHCSRCTPGFQCRHSPAASDESNTSPMCSSPIASPVCARPACAGWGGTRSARVRGSQPWCGSGCPAAVASGRGRTTVSTCPTWPSD